MIEITIERCDKCGKTFLSKSEVKRHMMYEHIIPVSPFEDKFPSVYENINPKDLHDLTANTSDININKNNKNNNIREVKRSISSNNRKSLLF